MKRHVKEEGKTTCKNVGRLLLGGVVVPIHSMALSGKGYVTFNILFYYHLH
jgi:hypothetical protein